MQASHPRSPRLQSLCSCPAPVAATQACPSSPSRSTPPHSPTRLLSDPQSLLYWPPPNLYVPRSKARCFNVNLDISWCNNCYFNDHSLINHPALQRNFVSRQFYPPRRLRFLDLWLPRPSFLTAAGFYDLRMEYQIINKIILIGLWFISASEDVIGTSLFVNIIVIKK